MDVSQVQTKTGLTAKISTVTGLVVTGLAGVVGLAAVMMVAGQPFPEAENNLVAPRSTNRSVTNTTNANANTNSTNTNTGVNTNTQVNTNSNGNTNGNTNSNANANANANTNTSVNVNISLP